MTATKRGSMRTLVLVWCMLAFSLGCMGTSLVDRECIKGRLSDKQAKEVNAGPWGHLPTYNQSESGGCKHCAEDGDRVLAARCSELVKKLMLDD